MQKLTLLDYPEKLACLLFTTGCNYRCPFCHNSELVLGNASTISEEEIFSYLEKRKNVLDAVVISGGEPTLQKDLKPFIGRIKDLGFLVKLDTNGTNPETIKSLLDDGLVDYIAMDIKSDFGNYEKITILNPQIENIKKSIKLIEESGIDYEFRTTVFKEIHGYKVLENILSYIEPTSKYFIQNYRECDTVFQKGLSSFSNVELEYLVSELKRYYPNVFLR